MRRNSNEPLLNDTKRSSYSFEDEKNGTFYSTTVNLACTTIGAGILSLPLTLRFTGWICGISGLLIFAVYTDISLLFLVRSSDISGEKTYESLVKYYFGKRGGKLMNYLVFIFLFLVLSTLLIIVGDLMVLFSDDVYEGNDSFFFKRPFVTFVSVLLVLPFCMAESLSALKITSSGALFVAFYCFLGMSYLLFERGIKDSVKRVKFDMDTFPIFLAIQSIAFCNQFNILPLYDEMKKSERKYIETSIHVAVLGISFFAFASFGLVGYFLYGNDVAGNVLVSEKSNALIITVAAISFGIINLLKFPLIMYPCIGSLKLLFESRNNMSVFLEKNRKLFILILCILSYILCLALASLAKAFQILGCSVGLLISFLIPATLYLKALYHIEVETNENDIGDVNSDFKTLLVEKQNSKSIFLEVIAWFTFPFGFALAVTGVAITIIKWNVDY